MKAISDRFSWRTYVLFMLALIAAMLLCICMGSVSIPLKDTLTAMWNTLWGLEVPQGISKNIILNALCEPLGGECCFPQAGKSSKGLMRRCIGGKITWLPCIVPSSCPTAH